ncbi:allantoinase AllB [Calidifontibacter sp. DB0510]|uniref:allantoinase n=1 Tax=Metallococcus carri TaxID=1656884 RepID=A0A967E9T6_9MICO|nr:allantoinase AllB [Metallococcus carri]NHN55560.1 allantoinase AllB [Metallococcus carri]NOP38256.1 allantoinase AllB [Calidifontibacter sp. DB2511S]
MSPDLVIRAASALIDGSVRPASVAITDGVVTAIGDLETPYAAAAEHRLADDEVLMPGMVDAHVHVNDPGRSEWEGFATATRAALAGGTTTIVDMPLNSLPPTTTVDALNVKKAAAQGNCYVDVAFWGGAVPGNIDDLRPLHEAGVCGFKCFLVDSGVPEFPPLSSAELRDYLARLAEFDALMIVHAEDAAALDAAPHQPGPRYADFLASRPDESEVTAIATVIDAVRATGARAHILHLSSAQALPQLRAAKAEGLPITVETCPHYLSFTAETIRDGSTAHKCCPPIRSSANQDELWAALADGTIDSVVSDHSPSTLDLKQLDSGDFAAAWGGVASVQVAFSAVWTAASARGHSLADVARWMCERPAQIAGLRSKGLVAVGHSADLTAFAPSRSWTVDAAALEHRNPLTAYQGMSLQGVVTGAWLRGMPVSARDAFGEPATPRGRFLTRGVD